MFKSLKSRLRFFLIFSCVVPIILISIVTVGKVYSLYDKNLQYSIETELNRSKENIANYIDSMVNMSQQLVFDGFIGKYIYAYFDEDRTKEKIEILEYINKQIINLEVTNPNISNITYMYKDENNKLKSINDSLVKEIEIEEEKIFYEFGDIKVFGFHPSNSVAWNNEVISLIRKVTVKGYNDIYIYIESDMKTMDKVLPVGLEKLGYIYNLVSNNSKISFSSNLDIMSSIYTEQLNKKEFEIISKKYYSYNIYDDSGWGVNMIIPTSLIMNYIISLGWGYLIIIIISILISSVTAYNIWKSINDPIMKFYNNIKNIKKDNIKNRIKKINIEEFDESFAYLEKMKGQIVELASTIEEEEKKKQELEIKQLFYKINPHFIYNTLESLKWYSESKGDKEVGKFISSLNKLLIYNLEKEQLTTIKDEINAIEYYIDLQRIKYNIRFNVEVNIPPIMLEGNIPRFVLQPIVENAIFYGQLKDGAIDIKLDVLINGHISIKVINKGKIIDRESTDFVSSKNNSNKSNKIGINYVKKILENQFGDTAKFSMKNIEDNKTQVEIIIPYSKGGFYVKNFSS